MTREEIYKRYELNLAAAARKKSYLNVAEHFLTHANGLDRESIDRYIAGLKKKYKPGTVNLQFRIIRRVFAVNGLEWPYKRGEAPQIKQRDESRPQLHPDIIHDMVAVALNDKLWPHEAYYLALSTTYGLRRGEMTGLNGRDFDRNLTTLYVATEKGGRERYHLIPPEIRLFIEGHDLADRYADSTLNQMFHKIIAKSGNKDPREYGIERIGWHSIRSSVTRGLIVNGLDIIRVGKFMRWKTVSGDIAMPARYYDGQVIGKEGFAPIVDEAKEDEEVFEKYHPFLPFWRDDA